MSSSVARCLRLRQGQAAQRAEVGERVDDRHVAIQTAVLGQVADARLVLDAGLPAEDADRAASGRMMSRIMRIVVVLPAPFGPRKPRISLRPRPRTRGRRRRQWMPKRFQTPSTTTDLPSLARCQLGRCLTRSAMSQAERYRTCAEAGKRRDGLSCLSMRIVSLLPSATEICFALGLGDELVGRTHECDYPPEAADVPGHDLRCRCGRDGHEPPDQRPRCGIGPRRRVDLPARRRRAGAGRSGPDPDPGAVRRLRRLVPRGRRGGAAGRHGLRDHQPRADEHRGHPQLDLDGRRVCRGRGRGGRPDRVAARAPGAHRKPRPGAPPRRRCRRGGSCRLEWLDPPFAAGHWVPEQVRRAGGWDLLGNAGQPAVETTWESVRDVEPEQLVLMPCGFDAQRTADEWRRGRASRPAVGRGSGRGPQRRGLRRRRLGLLQPAGSARHRRHRAARRDLRPGHVHRRGARGAFHRGAALA